MSETPHLFPGTPPEYLPKDWVAPTKPYEPDLSEGLKHPAIPETEVGDVIDPRIPPYLQEAGEIELSTHAPASSETLGGGANITRLTHLQDDGDAVFKPRNGEVFLRKSTEVGTYYRRERAAYIVSQLLDFDVVPPTIITEVSEEVGSLQDFVENANIGFNVDQDRLNDPEYTEELVMIWLTDYFIWNSDRHGGNYLVDDTRVYAIDNGLAFSKESYWDTIRSYSDEQLPDSVVARLSRFVEWPDGYEVMEAMLSELLAPDEVDAAMGRIKSAIEIILKEGKLDLSNYELSYSGVETRTSPRSSEPPSYGDLPRLI